MTRETGKTRITEKRNPASTDIDQKDTHKMLEIINNEDKKVALAVEKEIHNIKKTVDIITARMKKGGRLIYVGAGTSGRLGVLDAVECVPTFSVRPDMVTGILAGGEKAMFRSQENIEDNKELGKKRIIEENIDKNDSVVGIAASGKTPFVLGAVEEASQKGAFTSALVCVEESPLANIAEIAITPITGPEVITGSTRMKAGTAQKMVLNMISTTVMINLGKVYSNLMIDLNPSNQKLRDRAHNIFVLICGTDDKTANYYLKMADYDVKTAVTMYEREVSREKAIKLLKKEDGVLRKVIG